jgi:RHS repeat-associated protein
VRTTTEAYVGGQWTAFSSTERDFLGRLPLGIETSFADGSSKSWRFLRGPDVSGTLEGAGGARGVLAVLKDASSWKAVAADTLGNVLALAGTNGDFQRRTFDPWGNPLVRDASGSLRAATLNERRADYDALPLAWASQEVDPDTGLTHYHFREYSPSLGGWLTRDPIGLAGGYLNLRSYLGNRPADLLDLWGLEKYASEWLIEGREMEARGEKFKGACFQILGALTSGWNATLGINDDVNERMAEVDAEYREGERNGSKSKGEVALYRASRSATMASGLAGAGLLSSSANALNNPLETAGAMYDGAKAYPGRIANHAGVIADDPGSINAWSDLGGDVTDITLAVAGAKRFTQAARAKCSPCPKAAKRTPNLKTVTSWADEGITPDLKPGRWVQLGDATQSAFWRTGLPGPKLTLNPLRLEGSKVPFSNSVTGQVPASSLQWPSGWEKWKGILGQRQIMGDGQ